MNTFIGFLIGALLVGLGGYIYYQNEPATAQNPQPTPQATTTPPADPIVVDETQTVIGTSVQGRDIVAYHFGEGDDEIVFVGGMHGGYSWNTALLAFELRDHLEQNPNLVPAGVKATVIPVVNPDGLALVTGTTSRFTKADVSTSESTRTSGRFNANQVDLNRNFDCNWKQEGTWQQRSVSGGSTPFSEPEAQALRSYLETVKPEAVVVWYSAAGGVFPATCEDGPLPETFALTDAFARASGYKSFADFDFYEVTGDMPNWLAKIGVPAISVLLTDHEDTEWAKNWRGVEAVLKRYAN